MSGYGYGDSQPKEECPCCGGEATAEFVDVGVGMVQCQPYQCDDCGAFQGSGPPQRNPDGTWHHGWTVLPKPSELGEHVFGHYITPKGYVHECTSDNGHSEMAKRRGTSQHGLRWDGWIRVTLQEGFAISLPPFVTREAASALREVVSGIEPEWGPPYVTHAGVTYGEEMALPRLMAAVARLPRTRDGVRSGPPPEAAQPEPEAGASEDLEPATSPRF